MRQPRRRFGNWQLYTSKPVTLGCKPTNNNFIYHVPVRDCQTQQEYDNWVKHLAEKGFDINGFKLAIETLRAEGKYLKE